MSRDVESISFHDLTPADAAEARSLVLAGLSVHGGVEELVATAGRWGMARVTLETSTRWHDAIAFYRRCGFEITHEISGEFGSDTWFARQIR